MLQTEDGHERPPGIVPLHNGSSQPGNNISVEDGCSVVRSVPRTSYLMHALYRYSCFPRWEELNRGTLGPFHHL